MDNKIVVKSAYVSDAIFPEEIEALNGEIKFRGLKNIADNSDVSKFDIEAEHDDVEHSKEFVEFNFKLDYSGADENRPVSAKLDMGGDEMNKD